METLLTSEKCLKLHLALSFCKGLLDFIFWNVLTAQHTLKHSSCRSGALLWAYPSPHRKPPEDRLCPKHNTCEGESKPRQKKRHRYSCYNWMHCIVSHQGTDV